MKGRRGERKKARKYMRTLENPDEVVNAILGSSFVNGYYRHAFFGFENILTKLSCARCTESQYNHCTF